MKKINLLYLLLSLLFIFSNCETVNDNSNSNNVPAELLRIPLQSKVDQKERDYFLYLPKNYGVDPNEKFPVLMFLHGNGERGNGKDELDYVMIHGPLYEAWIQKRDLPFIMIVPQLPMFTMDVDYINNRTTDQIPKRLAEGTPPRDAAWTSEDPMLGALQSDTFPDGIITLPIGWDKCDEDIMAMFDHVLNNYNADKSRVYLSGLSYGGFGTWWIASKHPEMFAAINPVVGWGHPSLMDPIAKHQVPVWAFCGGRDPVVPCRYFYKGINRLEELGHKNIRFTTHEDMSHDAWKRVYAGEDLYNWFLSHQKK